MRPLSAFIALLSSQAALGETQCTGSLATENLSQHSLLLQTGRVHRQAPSKGADKEPSENGDSNLAGVPLDTEARSRGTVVVTGAAGFIGSHAVLALLAHGYRVIGVDNLSRGGYSETVKTLEDEVQRPDYAAGGSFEFYEVDIGHGNDFEGVLHKEKPLAVFHFAGVAYAGESALQPFQYFKNNTVNTMKVAEAMTEAGVKNLIYSSSGSTYGSPTEMPVTEETPQLPVNAYGRSKLHAEALLMDWERAQNAAGTSPPMKVVLMRYFNVIGSDPLLRVGERRPAGLDSKSKDYKLFVRLQTALFDAAEGLLPKFTIAGARYETDDGTAMRDYVHVRDVVDAHIAVLPTMLQSDGKSSLLPNLRYYNVGSGKAHSVREMVEAAKRVTGVDFAMAVGSGRATDPPAVWADPGKLFREVGWRPQYLNLTESLSHEWEFRRHLRGKSPPAAIQEDRRALRSVEIVDESGMSVADLVPSSEKGVGESSSGWAMTTDAVATGPGIPDAFAELLAVNFGGSGAEADTELGAAAAVEALEKECGGWDADASQPKNPGCMEKVFKPLEQKKLKVNRSMMVQEMDLVVPTKRNNLDFLEDWREFIEGMHVIVVQDGDPDRELAIPSWVDYELYTRRDINKTLGDNAWAISAKDSSIRIFGFLVSKKPFVFTLDDDVYPGRTPTGQRINAPLLHYRNLKTPSTPHYFNTLYDPFTPGADYVRGYPFSLRAGVPTAISHGLWLNTPDYDAPTQLLKPHERNTRYAHATMTVPHGTIYSMSGMNVAFNRKLIGPAFMFGLMGEGQPWGRYVDLWAGWASKACADHLGLGVKTGEPYVNHSKASNPFVNLKKEYRGLLWQEKIVKFFRNVKLSDEAAKGPAECYNELSGLVSQELGGIHPYFHRLSKAMLIWTSSWQAAEAGAMRFTPSRRSSGGVYLQLDRRRYCRSKKKLIVNSHVNYTKAVTKLFESLEKVGFKHWGDIVVFRGGAGKSSAPVTDWQGITYVNLTINSYDFNAFSGLYHYREDPQVCADTYLYILDTVEFDEHFPVAFDALQLEPGEQLMSPRPNSNIVAFGYGLVEKYGTNFDRVVTKQEGVWMEFGRMAIKGIEELEHFADKVNITVDRQRLGVADPYGTGHLRTTFYYPFFGIYKYILWNQMGDMNGDGPVEEIFPTHW